MLKLIALAVLLGGCDDTASSPRPLPSDVAPSPSAITDVQRPTRVYYLKSQKGKCDVYWVDGDARSVEKDVRCPRDFEDGEQIRLAGRTCIRESDKPERNVPVRCAKELFKAAQHDAADAGEWVLRPRP